MVDIEKVIAELTTLADRRNDSTCEGAKCCEIAEDALELLKELVKTKVMFRQCDGSVESYCGNCGYELYKAYSRCPKCQKALDWN